MKSLFRLVIIIALVVTIPLGWARERSNQPMTVPQAQKEVPGMTLRELIADRVQAEKEYGAVFRPAHPYRGADWAKPLYDKLTPAGKATVTLIPMVFLYTGFYSYQQIKAEDTALAEIPDVIWAQFEANIWELTVEAAERDIMGRPEWRRPIYDPAPVLAEAAQTQPGETVAHRECEFFQSADAQEPRYMLLSTDPVEVLQESTAERIQVNVTIERVGFTGEGWIEQDCLEVTDTDNDK